MGERITSPALLIVDDEPLIRNVVAEVLGTLGMVVIEAASTEEALRLLDDVDELEAVVTDVSMPGRRDGLDLAIEVRLRYPGVGIVLMSGKPLPDDRPLPKGAQYLAKPWTISLLEGTVRSVLPGFGQT